MRHENGRWSRHLAPLAGLIVERFNDFLPRATYPTRGGVLATTNVLLDAGVWRLGTEGRPTALVTVEIYQNPNG